MMKDLNNWSALSLSIVITFFLTACGGASNENSNHRLALNVDTPVASTGELVPLLDRPDFQVYGNSHTSIGSASGFAIIPTGNGVIDEVRWQQTSGEALTILASNTQTIGFDVPANGNYSLQVVVRLKGQTQEQLANIEFSASNEPTTGNIRLDHSVSEMAQVSLHAGTYAGKNIASVNWSQIAGPQAQAIQVSGDYIFFDTPSVNQDSIISFRADFTYSDGTVGNDDVLITVKNVDFDTNGLFFNGDSLITEDMFVYNQQSVFKDAVERCVYNNNISNPPDCRFSELPLIGSTTNGQTPSVEQILDRTLVSHQWMGQRFEQYLRQSAAGQDMRNLLRSVTAIVISYEVRPSFYWVATGAIYLDANNFWQTPAQRDTLNDAPDFRSDFGSDLQFSVFWRYTKNNEYYPSGRYAKQDRSNRSFSDLEASISWLMYHELAHANDFFPSSSWANLDANDTPLSYFNNNATNSELLDTRFPLRSDEMHALAQVRFRNTEATQTQKAYRGDDIASFFEPDIAPSFYAYLTTREDYATLFERYMMLYRLGSEADVAIIDGETENDYRLAWGQRNRITDPALADRTAFVVERVYPELGNIMPQLQQLPSPILMNLNVGWFGNLAISANDYPGVNSHQKNVNKVNRFEQARLDSQYIHETLHGKFGQ